jgi:hypothetical protein
MNVSRHHLCCFTIVPLFVLHKSMAWNKCLEHPCFKNLCRIAQASKNSDFNAQHFLLDLLTHSWFHSMLFALPSYQFPYIVMNRCMSLPYIKAGDRLAQWGPNDFFFLPQDSNAQKTVLLWFHRCKLERYGNFTKFAVEKGNRIFYSDAHHILPSLSNTMSCNIMTCTLPCI